VKLHIQYSLQLLDMVLGSSFIHSITTFRLLARDNSMHMFSALYSYVVCYRPSVRTSHGWIYWISQ